MGVSNSRVQTPVAIERTVLANGLAVLGSARPASPAVVLRARVRAGACHDSGETEGLARLTATMLQRGTARYRFSELNELTDGLGASIGVDAHRLYADLTVRCLAEDFPRLVEILADIVRQPTFPDDELAKTRGQALAAIVRGEQETRLVAERAVRELAYPSGHPYSRTVLGRRETVAPLARAALADFHARYYRPDMTTIAVVGGVAFADAVATIERAFGDWHVAGAPPVLAIPDATPPAGQRRRDVTIAGKTQADLVLGLPALGRDSPDYYAFDTVNLILGQLGLHGRLGASVREEQGLAYYAYSSLDGGLGPCLWGARSGVSPANVERAIASILDEVTRFREELVGEAELDDARAFLTGSLPLTLEGSGGVAAALLAIEFYDLGLDFLARYPAIVGALTREHLRDVARRYLHPDRLAIAVAGP